MKTEYDVWCSSSALSSSFTGTKYRILKKPKTQNLSKGKITAYHLKMGETQAWQFNKINIDYLFIEQLGLPPSLIGEV